MEQLIKKGIDLATEYGPKIIIAVLALVIGMWVIKRVTKLFRKILEKKNVDESLVPFLSSLVSTLLKIMLLISIASTLGFQTTSLIAVLGAASLAIGLALQGSLANFAGGVLILIFKPYKIGDLIETQGHLGVVKEIKIFNTILTSPEERTIILPNGVVSNGSIVNFTEQGFLRVDTTIGVAYDADIREVKKVIEDVLLADPKVMKDPAPTVRVGELADSSVNFVVRPYAKVEDYWDVYFNIHENVKMALDKANISIPFPQVEMKNL